MDRSALDLPATTSGPTDNNNLLIDTHDDTRRPSETTATSTSENGSNENPDGNDQSPQHDIKEENESEASNINDSNNKLDDGVRLSKSQSKVSTTKAEYDENEEPTWKIIIGRLFCIPAKKQTISAEEQDSEGGSSAENSALAQEKADKQTEIFSQLSRTLIIFIFYLQQISLLVTSEVDYPEKWNSYFGWVNRLTLNINLKFKFHTFTKETVEDVSILLAMYLAPLTLLYLFTIAVDQNNTNQRMGFGKMLLLVHYSLLGLAVILCGVAFLIGFLINWEITIFPFIIAGYLYFVGGYYILKKKLVEDVMVPAAVQQGIFEFIPRLNFNKTEMFTIQLLWTFMFTPLVSVWAKLAIMNSNIYIQGIAGSVGAFIVAYMVWFFIGLANASLPFHERSTFVSAFTDHFIKIGFARGKRIRPECISSMTEPFRKSIWWFQALFLIERLLINLSQNLFTLRQNGAAVEQLMGSYISLGIVVVFTLTIYVLLPYATSYDNRTDTVSRFSNIIILSLALANSFKSSDHNFELGADIVMIITSLIVLIFWIWHFKPIELVKAVHRKYRMARAKMFWMFINSFDKTSSVILSRADQKVKKEEWEVLTARQRFLTLCVDRKPNFTHHNHDIEKNNGLSAVSKEVDAVEYGFTSDYELKSTDRKVFRRYGFAAFTKLKILDLENSFLGLEAMKAIGGGTVGASAFSKLTQLRYLKLTHCKITNEGCKYLGKGLINLALVNIRLDYCQLTDSSSGYIADYLTQTVSLKKLVLHANYFTDNGASLIFRALKANSTMQVLDFQKNLISNEGAKIAAEMLICNCSLKKLTLLYNYISHPGLEYIAAALQTNHSLELLQFREQTPPEVLFDFIKTIESNLSEQQGSSDTFETVIPKFNDTFPPTTNNFCHNLLAFTLERNRVVHFDGNDSFIMNVRNKNKMFVVNVEESIGDDQKTEGVDAILDFDFDEAHNYSDYGSESGDPDSTTPIENDNNITPHVDLNICGFSEDAWKYAEAGLCCMVSTSFSYLSLGEKQKVHRFINLSSAVLGSEAGVGRTMMEVVLTKGVTHVFDSFKALLENGADLSVMSSKNNRSLGELALEHPDENIRNWTRKVYDCFAEKYELVSGLSPLYKTPSCKVIVAKNIYNHHQFAVKIVRDPNVILREIKFRNMLRNAAGYERFIIDDIWNSTWSKDYWDPPNASFLSIVDAHNTSFRGSEEAQLYWMVLPKADKDLAMILQTESVDLISGVYIIRQAATALKFLVDNQVCHCDFKPRNFLRMNFAGKSRAHYKLTDLDAAAKFGEKPGAKISTAYTPPEMARFMFSRDRYDFQPFAEAKYDIWQFGCVLFEILCNQSLFPDKTIPEDNIVLEQDKQVLVDWKGLGEMKSNDPELRWILPYILDEDELIQQTNSHFNMTLTSVKHLRELIYEIMDKCLAPTMAQRFSWEEILAHELILAEPNQYK